MIKRIIFILFLLILSPFVYASSIGISPTYNQYFFEPGIQKSFLFKISDSDPNQLVQIYVNGDLAEYANLSITSFKGFALVNLTITLPNHIELPGLHRIIIGAVESDDELDLNTGVKGLAAIQAPIDIYVPYPGKYAETSFQINNINSGENSTFSLEVNNLGTETIVIEPILDIYEGKNIFLTMVLNKSIVNSKEKTFYSGIIESFNFSSGVYPVNVRIDYGKLIDIKSEFRIGELYVNITDYSNLFEAKKVDKFYIEIENLWNLELNNVYSEVSITSEGKIIDKFKLSFIDLKPWEKKNLTGFFDASNISSGKYIANLNVFYMNQSTYKLVYIYVKDPPLDLKLLLSVFGIVLFFLILVAIIIYLILRMRAISGLKDNKIKKSLKNVKLKNN